MSDGLSLDLSEFTPNMELYIQLTKKTEAEALNKKALDVAYTAAQYTPKASRATVHASLTKDRHLLAALTSLHLRKAGIGILPKGQFKKAMTAFERARLLHIAYLRSGFAPAVYALKGKFRGGYSQKAVDKYESLTSRATPVQLLAEIVWVSDQPDDFHASTAESIAFEALQDAVDYQAEDMGKYIEEKISEL